MSGCTYSRHNACADLSALYSWVLYPICCEGVRVVSTMVTGADHGVRHYMRCQTQPYPCAGRCRMHPPCPPPPHTAPPPLPDAAGRSPTRLPDAAGCPNFFLSDVRIRFHGGHSNQMTTLENWKTETIRFNTSRESDTDSSRGGCRNSRQSTYTALSAF